MTPDQIDLETARYVAGVLFILGAVFAELTRRWLYCGHRVRHALGNVALALSCLCFMLILIGARDWVPLTPSITQHR